MSLHGGLRPAHEMSPTRTLGDSRDSAWGSEEELGPPTSQIKDALNMEQGSLEGSDLQCHLGS